MPQVILSLNTGSSSVKCAAFMVRSGTVELILKGAVDDLRSGAQAYIRDADGTIEARANTDGLGGGDQPTQWLVEQALTLIGEATTLAVVHRIVHGGTEFTSAVRVQPETLDALKRLAPMAPLHQMENLRPIEVISRNWPELAQFACFDTAFHAGRSSVAKRFGLPLEYERKGVIRYGFHGLSYTFIAQQLARLSPDVAAGRAIVAHLGSGASLCAMCDGRGVDTTMSFSPLDGLIMGTRCGDLDPGALLYLIKEMQIDVDALEELLYHGSGLLGVSGISADVRRLLDSPEPAAREAIALYCYSIVRHLGSMLTSLGGLDALVFTGGVGEHQPEIRRRVCQSLSWLGLSLNLAANERGSGRISTVDSSIEVWALATDEERVMAEQVAILLEGT